MKKVLFFLESLAGGGAEKTLANIVTSIDKSKFDITVCTVTNGDVYQKTVEEHVKYRSFLDTSSLRRGFFCGLLYRVRLKLIYLLPPKLVYFFYIKGQYDIECAFIEGFATKLIAASINRHSKKLAWVHTDMANNPYAKTVYGSQAHHCRVYRKFDTICCVSNNVKGVFTSMFFDNRKVIVQYNPVDSDDIIRKGLDLIDIIPDKTLQLCTIGRLEAQKGFSRLLECAGELFKEGFDFSLWIIGEGSQRQMLEEIIKRYNMERRVALLGFQSNPYKYLSKCDAFICSSFAEGFSTAATEAIILHKPVFTTNCAGMTELFGGQKCGEIVENTDQSLKQMLRRLVSGEIVPSDYLVEVSERAMDFDIKIRMREIEQLLDIPKEST